MISKHLELFSRQSATSKGHLL